MRSTSARADATPSCRPTSASAHFADGDDPQLAALYFQFGRYLLISSSRPGAQPANLQGLWNWQMKPPWESQLHDQHQHRDELLARRRREPGRVQRAAVHDDRRAGRIRPPHGRDDVRRPRLGRPPQHRPVAQHGAGRPAAQSGMWPTGGAWLCTHLWEHYLFTGDREFLAKHYPAMKGAGEFFLDTLVEDPTAQVPGDVPVACRRRIATPTATSPCAPGRRWTTRSSATCSRKRSTPRRFSASTPSCRSSSPRRATGCRPTRSAPRASCRNGSTTWTCRRPTSTTGTSRTCTASTRAARSRSAARPTWPPPCSKSLEIRGDNATGWGIGWRHQPVGPPAGRRAHLRHPRAAAQPRAHLPQHVRRPPAVPDRRQLRRHGRHRRDAPAKPRRRDRAAAGAAQGVADRLA